MSTTLLTCQSLQDRRGGVLEYISPTRLNSWTACPLKFKLQYIDGIRLPTTPSLFLGKCCHWALEVFYRHRMVGVTLEASDVVRRLEDSWGQMVEDEGMTFGSADDEQSLKKQTADLVRAYIAQVPADEPRPLAVEALMEAPLVDPAGGEDLGIPLVGIVDLVLDGDAGPTIIDFKTAARGGTLLEISHEVQLSSYAYAHRHVTGVEEGGLEIRRLIKTKTPRIDFHRYPARTDAHFRRLFGLIREYLDTLDSGRFNFRPGWSCGMCNFQETHCRAWCG